MAKAIDSTRFSRQITSKAMQHLSDRPPAKHFAEGDMVRVTTVGPSGRAKTTQGRVVGYSGFGANETVEIKSSRRGHVATTAFALLAPDLVDIDLVRDRGSRRPAVKGQTKSKIKSTKALKYGAFANVWGRGSKRSKAHKQRSEAIADAVGRAVAETVAEDKAVIIADAEPVAVALAERISAIIGDIRDASSNDRIEKLVELMLPAMDPVAEIRAKIEVDNAALRMRFLTEVPALTAAEVAAASGSKASNKSATANRWKTGGQIFSVSQAGRETFPAFQFQNGQPREIVARLLSVLRPHRSVWETAFWFVSSNPWLDGDVPAARLGDEAAVIKAAERSVEGLST